MRYVRASFSTVPFFFSTEAEAEAAGTKKAVTTIEGAAKSGDGGGGGRDMLGWRLIGLVYPKRSAVVTIRNGKRKAIRSVSTSSIESSESFARSSAISTLSRYHSY